MTAKSKRRLSLIKSPPADEGRSPVDEAILIVEDNEVLRRMFQSQLKVLKLKSDEATNGKEALDKFSENNYGLILMDVSMPVMDGLEATRLIRQFEQENARGRVPIVAVTGISDPEACAASGMDGFMTKPFLIEHMRAVVSRWLKQPVN
jgi:CheY-like chemotaxis protein